MLSYLLSNAELASIWDSVRHASPLLVLGGFLLFYMHFLLGAIRWRMIAGLHGADKPVGYYFVSFVVANFFNNFLPSTIGGDIVRAYDTWKAGTSKSAAAATIFADRVVGVLMLAIIAVGGSLLFGEHGIISVHLQLLLVLAVLGLFAVVAVLFHPPAWWTRLLSFAMQHPSKLIAKPAGLFDSVAREFKDAKTVLFGALLMSFVIHSNIIVAYFLVGKAVGIDLSFAVYFAVVPLALMIMMLPISINGIGLRESAFTVLLGLFGVSVSSALALAWTFYGLTLVHGALGGLVYLLRKERNGATEFRQGLEAQEARVS